jgi:maleylpyruvate isomerase
VDDLQRVSELARVAGERTTLLLTRLRQVEEASLEEPSELPGWSRLCIVCHLRYGARATLRMTNDALAGRETSYYPEGRELQRPSTLTPSAGEGPRDVLDDWDAAAGDLDRTWSAVERSQWGTEVVEPADNPDLGSVPLSRLALARLTEVDVHGSDLGIGVPDWSTTLVEVGLPTRLRWLSVRRTNHRPFDRSVQGAWLLAATDGPPWIVAVDGDDVTSRPATDADARRP